MTPTTVELANAGGVHSDPVLPFFLERYAAAYQSELYAFVAAATGSGVARPDGEDGIRVLLLADTAEQAARTGASIPS